MGSGAHSSKVGNQINGLRRITGTSAAFARGLCTYAEAEAFCKELDKRGMGGGVNPRLGSTDEEKLRATKENWETNGIYLLPWGGDFEEIHIGEAYQYQAHFKDGLSYLSIGSALDLFTRHPPQACWDQLTKELDEAARAAGL